MKRGGPLPRRTELRAVTPLRRTAPKPRTPKTAGAGRARPRDTGPGASVRRLVLDRAEGCCELCGEQLHDGTAWIAEHSFHHRRPRGMGGSTDPATNSPANLLLLCGSGIHRCHGLVESQRVMAATNGWLVAHGQDPTEVLVDLHVVPPGHRARLDHNGGLWITDNNDTWRLR